MKDLRKQNCDLSTAGIELGGFPFRKTARCQSVCRRGRQVALLYSFVGGKFIVFLLFDHLYRSH